MPLALDAAIEDGLESQANQKQSMKDVNYNRET
jgi:hypothetical protein